VRLTADAESKYLLSGFSYLKKDKYLPDDQCVPGYIVMHVIQLYMNSDGKGTHTVCRPSPVLCVCIDCINLSSEGGRMEICSGTC
jgi:hypothetical protein